MIWVVIGAVFGFFGVGLGAFGAHALRESLDERAMQTYQTAVQYQFVHALALIGLGLWWMQADRANAPLWMSAPGWCFALGTLLFSGSLYALALTGVRALGAITPVGGLLFLAGWLLWAIAGVKSV